jgi:hypothetical protein
MQRVALGVIIAILWPGPALVIPAHSSDPHEGLAPARTGKERLTDKGSDEQRMDDCKVPPARRTRERPSDCHTR